MKIQARRQGFPWWRDPGHVLACGLGLGLLPAAPGTFGTLLALPLYALLYPLPGPFYAAVVLALLGLGVWLCGRTATALGATDPGAIVWDEVVGFLITLGLAPIGWVWLILGFGLFRLFDILKPFPLRRLERLPGGWGIMLDDALAGIYAGLALQALAGMIR